MGQSFPLGDDRLMTREGLYSEDDDGIVTIQTLFQDASGARVEFLETRTRPGGSMGR